MATATLGVPTRRKTGHTRTATRFCEEANIEEYDQLDLAEFIVAAHYLGVGVDDGKLMDIFTQMEDEDGHSGKSPKEIIKELIAQIDEEYGDDAAAMAASKGGIGTLSEDKESDDKDGETEHEIVGSKLTIPIFKEDAEWQEVQIDSVL